MPAGATERTASTVSSLGIGATAATAATADAPTTTAHLPAGATATATNAAAPSAPACSENFSPAVSASSDEQVVRLNGPSGEDQGEDGNPSQRSSTLRISSRHNRPHDFPFA
ncbi:hypothetical protein ABLE91_00060 [Aquabacter sp. CN5-332]|uniref:hypothetical protein n=1 Tax=Aquabacter sp. CN5-332 TaxID=3156608 RepID=UPI0032B44C9C